MEKYHRIKVDGLPKEDGHYMVKFHINGRPEYDCTEIAFRNFKDGKFDVPYYSNPKTDVIVGWYEN